MSDNPLAGLIDQFATLASTVPDVLQPLVIATAAAVPFLEGEVAAVVGVLGGLHPVVVGLAAGTGNFLSILLVALLGARARGAVVARTGGPRRKREQSSGRQRFDRWFKRFGVPGASLLGPLAIPTQFTTATLVASGVPTRRVITWQAVAIAFWTTLSTASATVSLAVLT